MCNCKEYFYLKVDFDYYTEECEEIVLNMYRKMGAVVNKLTRPRTYVIVTDDIEIIDFIKYMAECDMIHLLTEEEEE